MATIAALRARTAASMRQDILAVPGLDMIGTPSEKAGVLSFMLDGCRTRGCRQGARSRRHSGARRSSLRAADPAAFRPGEHRASFACALQYDRRHRRACRRAASHRKPTRPQWALSQVAETAGWRPLRKMTQSRGGARRSLNVIAMRNRVLNVEEKPHDAANQ